MASTDKVHFSLDTIERPKNQVFETFYADLFGRRIAISDPAEVDWRTLATISKPMDFFKHCMSQEDRDWLADQDGIEAWQMGQLLEYYFEHYQAEKRIEERRALGL